MNKVNYANYSLDELNEALDSIDRKAFPKNYQLLINEIKLKIIELQQSQKEVELSVDEADKGKSSYNKEISDYWDPKTAKKNGKSVIRLIIFIKIFIVVGVLSLPAYFYSYLIEKSYYNLFGLIAWGISIITFYLVYFWRKNVAENTNNKLGDKPALNKSVLILLAIVLSASSYFISSKSLPVLAHVYFLEKNEAIKVVTVSKKSYRYRKKHCHGKLYLKEFDHSYFDYICGVLSKNTWDSLKNGDKITLIGTQSAFGFLVKGVNKVP